MMNGKMKCDHNRIFSALGKKEILPFTATHMKLETIVLGERSQTQKEVR